MKKSIITFLLLLSVVAAPLCVKAQAIHVLVACCTEDATIGEGVKANREHMTNLLQNVIAVLDCEYSFTTLEHKDVTKANVEQWIRDLIVEPDDAVIVFYNGHGGRAVEDTDPFPQMCMNTPSNQSLYMPVAQVDKLLSQKNPRLRVIITECCNSESKGIKVKPLYAMAAGDYTSLNSYSAKALRDLFINARGKVMMSSSKAKEYSWLNQFGGYFVNNFIDAFENATASGKTSASWDAIFAELHDKTWATNIVDRDGRVWHQEPIKDISSVSNNDRPVIKKKDEAKQTGTLFESLQYLVDKNVSTDTRLSRVAEVKARHFTADAKVMTVGTDMSTIVDYEDIDAFLRRVAISPYIVQLNVMSGSDNGKNSVIKVHEVRK